MLAILAIITVMGVGWGLHSDGLSMTGSYLCGLEEHEHTDSCYTEELTCGQEESEEHQHTEDCYSSVLTCDLPEHTHTEACLPSDDGETDDSTADETSEETEEPDTDWAEYDSSDSSSVTAQAEADAVDMSGQITGLSGEGTTYDADGNMYSSKLKAEFSFDTVSSDTLYYFEYPEGIIVPDDLLNDEHTLKDGDEKSGTYRFEKTEDGKYRVYVKFDQNYVSSHTGQITGYIQFDGKVDGRKGQDDGSIKVVGKDDVTLEIDKDKITYPGNATNKFDITTKKEGSYTAKNGKLVYRVTVNSLKGTPGEVEFIDQLKTDLTLGEPTEVTVKQKTVTRWYQPGGGYNGDTASDGDSVDVTYTYENGKLTMTLPQMKSEISDEKDDGSYTLKYTQYEIEYIYNAPLKEGASAEIRNDVTTSSTDQKTTIESSDSTKLTISNNYTIKKSGQPNVMQDYIVWTITINENGLDIADATLRDEMLKNLYGTEYRISPDKGWKWAYDENGKIIGIDFSATDGTENRNTYTITYRTPAQGKWNETTTVKNDAKFTSPSGDTEKDATDEAEIKGPYVKKTFDSAAVDRDGQTAEVNWTVTITAPTDKIPAGTVITDNPTQDKNGMAGKPQYFTREQVIQRASGICWADSQGKLLESVDLTDSSIADVTFLGSDGTTYSWQDIRDTDSELTYTLCTVTLKQDLTPPAGAAFLRFQYATTADLSKAETGVTSYYQNSVQVGDKTADANYPYQKEGVIKTDENGSIDTTTKTNKDGELIWKVKAVISEDTDQLTITDTLPANVTLKSLTGEDWLAQQTFTIASDGKITGTATQNRIGESNYTGNKLTVVVEPLNGKLPAGSYTLVLRCEVDSSLLDGSGEMHTFTNSAHAETNRGSLGDAEQTQEWHEDTSKPEVKVIDKSGEWENETRRAKYSIALNPNGDDIVPGSEVLELKDVLTYYPVLYGEKWENGEKKDSHEYPLSAYLLPTTVKLYKGIPNSAGGLTKGEEITNWTWTVETATDVGDLKSNTSTLIGKNLPDSTPLILEYEYQFASDMPSNYTASMQGKLNNTAELLGTGYQDTSNRTDDIWKESHTTGAVTSGNSGILYKVSKGNYGKMLPGAEFTLQKYTNGSWTDTETVYTTGLDGKITIKWQESTADVQYEYNVLYRAVETKAPNGCFLPNDPEANAFYFYFSSTADTTNTLPDNLAALAPSASDLSSASKVVYVENESSMTEITINKIWLDKDGNVSSSHNSGHVTVQLYRKASSKAPSGGGATATLKGEIKQGDITWSTVWKTFEEKEYPAGTTIRFTITVKNVWCTNQPDMYVNDTAIAAETGKDASGNTTYTYTFELKTGNNTILGAVKDTWQPDSDYELSEITAEKPSTGGDDGDSTESEDELVGTYTITAENGWSLTIPNLPKSGTVDGKTVYYTYYVKEVENGNYEVTYDNNEGIASGTITVINKTSDEPSYELPETGGSGTFGFAAAGAALMGAALLGGYNKKRRKRGMNS